jgi:dihydropyrimidinase
MGNLFSARAAKSVTRGWPPGPGRAACQNAMVGFDLVIRGATVVVPGHREAADIGIADGRIAQLGGTMTGVRELEAGGLLAIPGGVDAHTHLLNQELGEKFGWFPIWVDDFWSGSRAAIAGGITTIGNMTFPVPDETGAEETPGAAITREMADAAAGAAVDWFLHPVLLHPAALPAGEIAALAGRGHSSIKMFLSDPDVAADEPALLATAGAAQAAGSVTLLHCEDGAMLRQAGEKLIAEGRGAVANFPDARPVAAEVAAVDQAIGIARRTGARVYIVHLSSAAALDRCRRARAAGLPVYVETRPLYLHLTRERFAEPDAAKYAGAPPLRGQADRQALWAGLAGGDVDTLCSDHAPWTLEAKLDPALTAATARQGVADLETMMPMLYSEGVASGRLSLDQFVALTSANAARIFGLYPRKGVIAVGSDADIALWDPGHRRTIDGARMHSRAGYSVYDGWQVQGWPRFVIRRGQVVLADGEITARPGDGEWLRRTTQVRTSRRRFGLRGRASPHAYEAALALTQNAAERAYLVTTPAAQRPGHPDGVADGQGQAGGDGQVDGDGGVVGDAQVAGDGGVVGDGGAGTGREVAGNGYPHAARAQRGERQGDGAEEARGHHREEAPEQHPASAAPPCAERQAAARQQDRAAGGRDGPHQPHGIDNHGVLGRQAGPARGL